MDMTLRYAIAISAMLHSMVMLPLFNSVLPDKHDKPKDSIIVDYISVKETPAIEAKTERKTIETPKVELKKDVELKSAADILPQTSNRVEPAKESAQDLAKKQAKVRNTRDYISYYQLIREKIRQRLKVNYTDYNKEGDVNLAFELNSDGKLVSLAIENAGSTADKVLRNIATLSVKQSSPFAPFPQKLNLPKMSFNLTVSFKKE